jgi:hypothetical protein
MRLIFGRGLSFANVLRACSGPASDATLSSDWQIFLRLDRRDQRTAPRYNPLTLLSSRLAKIRQRLGSECKPRQSRPDLQGFIGLASRGFALDARWMAYTADKALVQRQLLATLIGQAQLCEQIANSCADELEAKRFMTFARECRAATESRGEGARAIALLGGSPSF